VKFIRGVLFFNISLFFVKLDQEAKISNGVKSHNNSTSNNNNIPTLKVIKKNFTSHDIYFFFFTNMCVLCVITVEWQKVTRDFWRNSFMKLFFKQF
jgi:hypothetical protein